MDPDYYLENGFDEQVNYVDLLQQWYQKKYHRIPVYCFRDLFGIPYAGKFGKYVCGLSLSPIEKGFWDVGNNKSQVRLAVAEQAYRYLEENDLLFSWIDEIGAPNIERAINQLQELYQKGYIGEPWYDFSETYDENGNPIWHCECHIKDSEMYFEAEYSSKKYGKKAVAYGLLCDLLDWREEQ